MKLSAKKRNALPAKSFAVAGRKYPIEDKAHARDALSRVAADGSPAEKSEVRAKVKADYPAMGAPKKGGAMKAPKAPAHPTTHRQFEQLGSDE